LPNFARELTTVVQPPLGEECIMRAISRFVLAAAAAAIFASTVHAQGTNLWTQGYPRPGSTSGTIDVSGQVVPDTGWTAATSGAVQIWLVGSGPVSNYSISVDGNGNWQATISGLDSTAAYNVVVEVNVTMGVSAATIATDPAVVQMQPGGPRRRN
jgi:hypothetical protein